MSLNKIKINQLDFDVSQIALSVGSGSFISNENLTASSGALRGDISNQANLISQLSTSGSLISGRVSSLSGNCVFLTGDQNITGIKNFESVPTYKDSQLLYRTQIDIPNLVYATGSQTINGSKNFTSRITVNNTGVLLSGEAFPLKSILSSSDLLIQDTSNLSIPSSATSRNAEIAIGFDFFNKIPLQNSIGLRLPYASAAGDTIKINITGIPANKSIQIRSWDPASGWMALYSYPSVSAERFFNDSEIFEFFSLGVNGGGYSPWRENLGPDWNSLNGIRSIKNKADFTYNTGDQTINGQKTLQHPILVSGRRGLLEGDSSIVFVTGTQNIGGSKNFNGQRPQVSGFGILHSGEVALKSHTHELSEVNGLNSALSGKVNLLEYVSDVISSNTPKTPNSNGNSLFNYIINHTGSNIVRLPRLGVAGEPRDGDEITLQFSAAIGVTPSAAIVQTGNTAGEFSDFFTINNGVGGVSVFHAGNFWRLKSPIVNHASTHFTNGLDPITPLNIGAAPRQDFASFEWDSPRFNFARATGTLDGNGNGIIHNSAPANYVPFNNTSFNTNTGVFELINSNLVTEANKNNWNSTLFFGSTGSRIKISQSGVYEFNIFTHFYDATGNCDFYVNLVRTNGSSSPSWNHITTLVDERFNEKKTDRLQNATYLHNKVTSNVEYFTIAVVSDCGQGPGSTALFPSSDGAPPARIQIKKLL